MSASTPTPSFVATGPATRTGHSAAETVPAAPAPTLVAGTTPLYRVFWSVGGDPVFCDETGRCSFIHVATLRAVRNALWRLARDARGRPRDQLCILWAQADETLNDVTNWRMAAASESCRDEHRASAASFRAQAAAVAPASRKAAA